MIIIPRLYFLICFRLLYTSWRTESSGPDHPPLQTLGRLPDQEAGLVRLRPPKAEAGPGPGGGGGLGSIPGAGTGLEAESGPET